MRKQRTFYSWLTLIWYAGTAFVLVLAAIATSSRPGQNAEVRGIAALSVYLYVPYTFVFLGVTLVGSIFPSRKVILRNLETRCPTCNYDLRATPDRCPECGTVIPKRD